jgi:hypothetical protein
MALALVCRDNEGLPPLSYVLGLTGLTTEGKGYLETLLDDFYPESDMSYDEIKGLIVSWEANIESQSLSNSEKSKLYNIGSVLRYSLLAWNEAEMPLSTNGHVQLKTTGLFRWIAAAAFDAGGMIAGPVAAGIASVGCFAVCTFNGW